MAADCASRWGVVEMRAAAGEARHRAAVPGQVKGRARAVSSPAQQRLLAVMAELVGMNPLSVAKVRIEYSFTI